ncbi:alpha/beta hydrolase [Tomitella fengzijianii]|uniref:Acyl-CoA:diacylglycerol acyltransferase n=1 Tax=Tomitella fengzijianii TaxID=2597660 RepID=A0A516X5V5_9ACTN|nr:alpha/beta hydrolase family protein [Tomitella fengzijianii]QDQ98439.1 esterase family protein [Tomitella fengzijianii]
MTAPDPISSSARARLTGRSRRARIRAAATAMSAAVAASVSVAVPVAVSVTAAQPAAAAPLSSGSGAGGSAESSAQSMTGSGEAVGSASPFGSTDTASLGSTVALPMDAVFGSSGLLEDPYTVPRPDPSITQTRVVRVEQDVDDPRLETWYVDSASMSRTIAVQVLRAADPGAPAPMLYLLDGVGSDLPSGWITLGHADDYFRDKQVTVVMPTGAYGSMYTDWIADDPMLSRNKWETFLASELPPLLESGGHAIPFNGKRAIAGLSMGASGAVGIAALHPSLYSAVAGISGCYSTVSDAGYAMTKMTVETRLGDVTNMWGTRDNPEWARHDVLSHADALAGMAVYLSASPGIGRPGELEGPYGGDMSAYLSGAVIEQFIYGCTQDLDRALDDVDADVRVDYLQDGLHGWQTFRPQLAPAWEHMSRALY